MDYSLRELECFIAVAEELSFTRAARRLNLAQPPLSRHVRTLEEKIGTTLFIREPRGVALTAAGAVFLDETRHIPLRLSRAGEMARRCAAGETVRLRLGFVSAVMDDNLAGILRRFRDLHSSVQIMLHDLPPGDQLRAIREGRLDGGFVGIEPPDETTGGVRFIPWRHEPLLCFLPSDHPLAGRSEIALTELSEDSFIAVSSESAPAYSNHWRELCRAAGFRPRVILESPRAQAVAMMVAAGSGVAVLPRSIASLVSEGLAALPINGLPTVTHVFAVTGKSDGALADFVKLIAG